MKLTDSEISRLENLEYVIKKSEESNSLDEFRAFILEEIRQLKIREDENQIEARVVEMSLLSTSKSHVKEESKPLVIKMCTDEINIYRNHLDKIKNCQPYEVVSL
jgi:hypothetical protein